MEGDPTLQRIPPVSLPPAIQKLRLLSTGAQKFFNQLDLKQRGTLKGSAVTALAEWVCGSLHPGEQVSGIDVMLEEKEIRKASELDGA